MKRILIIVGIVMGIFAVFYLFQWCAKRPRPNAAMQTIKEIETRKMETASNVNVSNKKYPDENLLSNRVALRAYRAAELPFFLS